MHASTLRGCSKSISTGKANLYASKFWKAVITAEDRKGGSLESAITAD